MRKPAEQSASSASAAAHAAARTPLSPAAPAEAAREQRAGWKPAPQLGQQEAAAQSAPPATPAPDREQAIRDDPLVKKAVEVFGGRVVHVDPKKGKEG